MIVATIAVLLQAAAVPAPVQPPLVPPPVADWPTLPPLPWRTPPLLSREVTGFVADEVRAGRCVPAKPDSVSLEMAVAVTDGSSVRAAIPQAIGCRTVEQFAVGLVSGFARNNLRNSAPGWYRVTVSFTLPE